jgi:hypothetical protein
LFRSGAAVRIMSANPCESSSVQVRVCSDDR